MDYSPSMIYVSGTLIHELKTPDLAYGCFERLMDLYSSHPNQISTLKMLFKSLIPDLYSHFEDEEVDLKEFMSSWLGSLLSKELSLDLTLRLWDALFSMGDQGPSYIIYVCLAILYCCKTSLEELEQSEIRSFLLKLPFMDMDQILSEADRFRYESMEHQLVTETCMRLF